MPYYYDQRRAERGNGRLCPTWVIVLLGVLFSLIIFGGVGLVFWLVFYNDVELEYYKVRLDYGGSKSLNITN